MSKAFFDMMVLFACGARDIKPILPENMNIYEVRKQAMLQGVWEIVFIALRKLYEAGELAIEKELIESWHTAINFTVMNTIKRQVAVHDIIKALEEDGVDCCILKGDVLASLYASPSCRIASDTDILIEEKLEKKAISVLKARDFEIEERLKASNQTVARGPLAGTIEMHVSLNNKLMDDVWFDKQADKTEDYRKFKTHNGYIYNTVGINDGLILVTLHFIKHFINRAAGIRMIMDTLLYMVHYKNQINWEQFNALMKHLKYHKFIDIIIGIGIKYMFFTENDLKRVAVSDQLMEEVLNDMEEGGVKGFHSIERMGFYEIYSSERYNTYKKGEYKKYQRKMFLADLKSIIFLDKEKMSEAYPYVKKSNLLLPVAWTHRIFNVCLNKITGKNPNALDEKDTEAVNRRMELIRDLDMI